MIINAKTKLAVVSMLCLMIVPLSACGIFASSRSLSPEEVIAKSKAVMAELKTYRSEIMAVTVDENGETNRSSAIMEVVAPDRSHTESTDGESISIGNEVYQRSTTGVAWSVRHFDQPFVNAEKYASGMFYEPLVGLVALPDEEIDGELCFHFTGSRDMKAVAEEQTENMELPDPSDPHYADVRQSQEMMAQNLASITLNVEFWIDKDDFFVRKAGFEQKTPVLEDDGKPRTEITTTGTFRFYDFDADITIEPPTDIEVLK
jgi:hypothetical protein